ncbi:unnamed protein product [Durusdinium trenchii]|uniref:Uncharacterized protein n=1 Tax=Durusdinium trenchii TaxID=1381693 RepID=A0ABP0L2F8_9DINO
MASAFEVTVRRDSVLGIWGAKRRDHRSHNSYIHQYDTALDQSKAQERLRKDLFLATYDFHAFSGSSSFVALVNEPGAITGCSIRPDTGDVRRPCPRFSVTQLASAVTARKSPFIGWHFDWIDFKAGC